MFFLLLSVLVCVVLCCVSLCCVVLCRNSELERQLSVCASELSERESEVRAMRVEVSQLRAEQEQHTHNRQLLCEQTEQHTLQVKHICPASQTYAHSFVPTQRVPSFTLVQSRNNLFPSRLCCWLLAAPGYKHLR